MGREPPQLGATVSEQLLPLHLGSSDITPQAMMAKICCLTTGMCSI